MRMVLLPMDYVHRFFHPLTFADPKPFFVAPT